MMQALLNIESQQGGVLTSRTTMEVQLMLEVDLWIYNTDELFNKLKDR